VTAPAQGRRSDSYLSALDKEGLKGARVGVVRQLFAGSESDPEVLHLLEQALADTKRKGAEIVEGVNVSEIDRIPPSKLACDRFKYDINMYLARLGPPAPKNLDDIIASQKFLNTMDDSRLDALVYPTSNNPPRLIGDLNTPHGNNSPRLSPFTGFPALTVPMGYARGVLPVGLQILGRPLSEPTLFTIAYSYEQGTLSCDGGGFAPR
jgi:amidase